MTELPQELILELFKMKTDKDIVRIAAIALLVAMNAFILQYIPAGQKISVIGISLGLKVMADVFFKLVFGFFLVFTLLLLLELGYHTKVKFPYKIFYDFGITAAVLSLSWTVIILVGMKFFGNNIFAAIIYLLVVVFWLVRTLMKNLTYYWDNLFPYLKKKINEYAECFYEKGKRKRLGYLIITVIIILLAYIYWLIFQVK